MKRLRFAGMIPFFMLMFGGIAFAQYSSSHYTSNEVFFGNGGDNGQASANYNATVSSGALGVGRYNSANYQAYSGFLTPNEPFLELGIDSSNADLGSLDPTVTVTGTANFHVRAYLDSGYTVQTVSNPPSYTSGTATHTLSGLPSPTASSAGVEEFGINLVHNTSPANFGSDPVPFPGASYANGIAAPGYNTANVFKYVVGDTVARTPAGSNGWGLTNYTISYIANASILTPAGKYIMVHDLVAVATY